MSRRYLATLGLQVALALGVTGAVSAHAQSSTVIIAPDTPPPQVDAIPPPPTADADAEVMTWHAGHWMWTGSNWDWDPGRYVQQPAPTAVWEPGHWSQESSGGYVWIDGHWRG
jgi:hypothetical protein